MTLAEALRRPGGINSTRRVDMFDGGVNQSTNWNTYNSYGSGTGWPGRMARGNAHGPVERGVFGYHDITQHPVDP